MFQILEFIESRLATLTPRSEKHGDDDVPAVSLGLEITCANTLLDVIDPKIRHSLYMAVDGQEQLPGVEQSTPVLRCNSFDRHTLPAKYEGWTMQIKSFLFTKNGGDAAPTANKRKDNVTGALDGVEVVSDLPKLSGVGSAVKTLNWDVEVTGGELTIAFATTKLLIDDCKAHSFRIKPKEGGTVQVKFIIDAPNASEKVFAKLAKYKSREVEISFVQHEPAQQSIEERRGDGPWPFPKDADGEKPPQSATTEVVKPGRGKKTGNEAGDAFAAANTH